MRERGGIVVVVAHRPSADRGVDMLLVMKDGRMQAFGPKEKCSARVLQQRGGAGAPIKVVPEAGVAKS